MIAGDLIPVIGVCLVGVIVYSGLVITDSTVSWPSRILWIIAGAMVVGFGTLTMTMALG